MAKTRKKLAYTHHKGTNQARVRINGKDHYLGEYGSPESRAIRGKKRTTELQIRSEWSQLVVAVADGTLKDPSAAAATMAKLGKTEADLTDAVAHLERRRALAKQIADVKDADGEIAKLDRQIDAAQAKIEQVHAECDPIIRTAAYWVSDWRQKQQAAEQAEATLMRTGNDPDILAEIEALNSQINDLAQRETNLKAMRRNMEETVGTAERQWNEHCRQGGINKLPNEPRGAAPTMSASFPPEDFTAEIKDHLVSVRQKLADINTELGTVAGELASLNAKVATVRRKFLDPTL